MGVLLLLGFDNVITPLADGWLQRVKLSVTDPGLSRLLTFSNWKLMIFGLALILMMRFRPEGLLPSKRIERELHEAEE